MPGRLTAVLLACLVVCATPRASSGQTDPEPSLPQDGRARLFHAAGTGDVALVASLLEADPGLVSARDERFGGTALHFAAASGHDRVIRLLIEHGSDPRALNGAGETAAQVAWRTRQFAVLPLLLSPAEAIVAAARIGDDTRVQELLAADGSLVNSRDPASGFTALHWAGYNGRAPLVARLLAVGADRTLRNSMGETPLGVAQKQRSFAAVQASQVIMDAASGNPQGLYGLPVDGAAAMGRGWATMSQYESVIRLLMAPEQAVFEVLAVADAGTFRAWIERFPSSVRATDAEYGGTPLHWAVARRQTDTIAALLEHGADPLARNKAGATPVDLAIRGENRAIVEMLQGAPPGRRP